MRGKDTAEFGLYTMRRRSEMGEVIPFHRPEKQHRLQPSLWMWMFFWPLLVAHAIFKTYGEDR